MFLPRVDNYDWERGAVDNLFDRLLGKLLSSVGSAVLLGAVVGCVFSPCLFAGFLNWDDPEHLLKNPLLPLHSWADVIRIFCTADTANQTYNPLVILSFGAEWAVAGLRPWVFHLDNILLHILAAILVRSLALRLGLSLGGALLAAMVFAVHPMRVESVAWVTERKDVLFGVFYLGALILYWDYIRGGRRYSYIGALLCGIASILAKPMALSLPLALFLLDYMARRRFSVASGIDKLPFMLTLWPVAGVTFFMNIRHPAEGGLNALLVGAYSALFYVVQFFCPFRSAIIYTVPRPIALATPEYFWAIPLLILVAVLVWFGRKDRWVKFAFLFYILTMFFLWKTDLFDGAKGIVSDRFMYIPSIGFSLLLGHWWDNWLALGVRTAFMRWGMGVTVVLLMALAGMTFHRCFAWRDNLVFWTDVLRNDPDNTFALFNRASCVLEDQEVVRRYALSYEVRHMLALRDLQKAASRAPGDPEIWNNLGVVLERLGRREDADAAFAMSDRLGGVARH